MFLLSLSDHVRGCYTVAFVIHPQYMIDPLPLSQSDHFAPSVGSTPLYISSFDSDGQIQIMI